MRLEISHNYSFILISLGTNFSQLLDIHLHSYLLLSVSFELGTYLLREVQILKNFVLSFYFIWGHLLLECRYLHNFPTLVKLRLRKDHITKEKRKCFLITTYIYFIFSSWYFLCFILPKKMLFQTSHS